MREKEAGYDIIGDVHGYARELRALLEKLGYKSASGVHRHGRGRRAIFLGDWVDRGPEIEEVLQIVREMCEAGSALAVVGNHEFNAVAFATPVGDGRWLLPHTIANTAMQSATLEQFAGREAEWRSYLDWFCTLPLALELPGLRVVHAAWDVHAVSRLGMNARMSRTLVAAASVSGSEMKRDVDALLRGIEIALPEEGFYRDSHGVARYKIRTRWWLPAQGATYRQIALQPGCADEGIPELSAAEHANLLPGYGVDEPPVFNGHYWLEGAPSLMAPNIAILDYGIARGGALTAYRWDGEQVLDPGKFVEVRAMPR